MLVIRDGERVVLKRRPKKGLLAGLYEFPNEPGTLTEDEALRAVQDMHLHPMRIQRLEEAKHIFQNNFAEIDDVAAKKFVENSFREDQQHFAIVDDQDDEYLGTISLKNIDLKNKNAEYAISTRKKARGTGANQKATESLLKYGFDKLQLHRIYLNVLSSNKRAISFYKK